MPLKDIEQRTDHANPTLYGQQLPYLTRGETGSYNEKYLRDHIKSEKSPLLGVRFRYLIEDVALLHTSDMIEADQWEMIWEQLAENAHQNAVFSGPRGIKNLSEDELLYYKFGAQFGHLARLLAKNSAPEFRDKEIILGFILGLAGELMADIDSLSTDETDDSETTFSGSSTEMIKFLQRLKDSVAESISDHPSYPSPENEVAEQTLRRAGLEPNPALRDEVIDQVMAKAKELLPWIYSEEYQPSQDHQTPEWDPLPPEHLFINVVEDLKSNDRITKVQQLGECIFEELDALETHKYGSHDNPVRATEVFYAICSEDKPSKGTIRSIVREHRSDRPDNQVINNARNDITGDRTDIDRWAEYPLAEEGSTGYTLTNYGELIKIVFMPDAINVDENEYLPHAAEDTPYTLPSEKAILTACYACAFGRLGEIHKTHFDEAYKERIDN